MTMMSLNAIENRAGGAAGLVAVTDKMETAGAIIWWRLMGVVDAARLESAWVSAGLEAALLPTPPTPEKALRRAAKELQGQRRIVSQLETGGWAVVQQTTQGEDLGHKIIARAELTGDALVVRTEDRKMEEQLRASYERQIGSLTQGDISGWLVAMAEHVRAVGLRDTGGIYFVPRDRLDLWRRIVGAIRAATQLTIYEVPALQSTEAINAILAAVTREAEGTAQEMDADLERGDIGARALETRVERVRAMMTKLGAYDSVLGAALDGLRDRLQHLSSGLVTAAMQKRAAAGEEV